MKLSIVSLILITFLMLPGTVVAAFLNGDINQDSKVDIVDIGIVIDNYGKTTLNNPRSDVNHDNKVDIVDIGLVLDDYGKTSLSSPTPTATARPTATGATSPTATPTGNVGNNKYGVYPNCIPPAMPVEAQTWWLEKQHPQPGDETARHIHAAACLPNARDTSGRLVSVSGTMEFVRLILIHNSNIRIGKGDNGFPEVGSGPEFPIRFNPTLTCPNRGINCTFYSTNRIDTTIVPDGLHELRWRVEGIHPDLANDKEFISFATKLYTKNGKSTNSTASNPDPRARGWYEGVEYDAAEIANYVDLYQGRTDISVPVLKGQVTLQMNHTQSSGGTLRSRLYLDPDFHHGSRGTVLYDKPGLFKGSYTLDTTRIPNGRHALVMETEHNDNLQGIHSGLLKLFIDVAN